MMIRQNLCGQGLLPGDRAAGRITGLPRRRRAAVRLSRGGGPRGRTAVRLAGPGVRICRGRWEGADWRFLCPPARGPAAG